MSKVVNFSEAAYIGLHAMVLIAQSKDNKINVDKIAERTHTSRHHVAKVVQRLVKTGMLSSARGPNGGFTMKVNPQELSFLDIFEAIEGKIECTQCPNNYPVCPFDKCIMNNVVKKMTEEFRDYLKSQFLSEYMDKSGKE